MRAPLTAGVRPSMKRLFALLLMASIAMSALAEQRFKSIDEYYEAVGATEHRPHAADRANANGRLVVGLLQVWPTPEEPKAIVFVTQESPAGEIAEVERSKPFDFGDGGARTYVSSVEAQSNSRFAIQISYQGACLPSSDEYSFSMQNKSWVVSGRDSTRYRCPEYDQNVGDTRTEISSNFLTGRIITREFKQDKLTKRTIKHKAFKKLLLRDFDPLQETYGPR